MGILWRALGPLGVANKFASASSILFNDSFDTDGAISAGARTADPGPGTATITDSAAVWTSIASNILTPAKKTEVADEPRYVAGPYDYIPGRALIVNAAWINLGGAADKMTEIGFLDSGTGTELAAGCYWQDVIRMSDWGVRDAMGVALPAAGTYAQIAVVLQDDTVAMLDPGYQELGTAQNGGFYLFVNKKLRYTSLWGWPIAFSDLYAVVRNNFTEGAGRNPVALDYVRVKNLGAPFSDGSFATVDERPPSWDTTYTADADGFYQFIFSSALLAPVGTPEMRFRVQDANNYWRAYVDIATGNIKLDSVESGVATNRITGSNINWYPAQSWYGFRVIAEGTTVQLFSQSAGYVVYEGSVTLDYLTSATGVRVTQTDTDYTARSLVCYPISSAAYDVFDEV